MRSHVKFGTDRFGCFDVYWIQTNRHPDKGSKYIDARKIIMKSANFFVFVLYKEKMLTDFARIKFLEPDTEFNEFKQPTAGSFL